MYHVKPTVRDRKLPQYKMLILAPVGGIWQLAGWAVLIRCRKTAT